MTRKKRELTGQKFGWLVVLSRAEDQVIAGKLQRAWLCECRCGVRTIAPAISLGSGVFRSCGCARSLPEYRSWNHMVSRCRNPNNSQFNNYGGRGIAVCERWRSFENFYADMGPRPGPEYSIDRIDNNGNYEPGNCRWATAKAQMRNMSKNVLIEYRGERHTISGLAELHGMSPHVLRARLQRGVPVEDAIAQPVNGRKATEETKAKLRAVWARRKEAGRINNRRLNAQEPTNER